MRLNVIQVPGTSLQQQSLFRSRRRSCFVSPDSRRGIGPASHRLFLAGHFSSGWRPSCRILPFEGTSIARRAKFIGSAEVAEPTLFELAVSAKAYSEGLLRSNLVAGRKWRFSTEFCGAVATAFFNSSAELVLHSL